MTPADIAAGAQPKATNVELPALDDLADVVHSQGTREYWREYVLPWIGRRLTGRSSGDHREPKSATLEPVVLPGL